MMWLKLAPVLLLLAASPQVKPILTDTVNAVDQRLPRAAASNIGLFHLGQAPEQGVLTLGLLPPNTKRLVVDGHDVRFSTDGRFVVGFGRDYATSTLITAFLADGRNISERILVLPHHWEISVLPGLAHHVQPDAEFQARRPAELAAISSARQMSTDAQGWRQTFMWPAHGRVSDLFGSQRVYGTEPGAPHAGVDVAIPTGTPVFAPADGVVILAADHPFTLEGNLLMLDHGMGVNSAFLHLSKIGVKLGDHIRQGQLLGYSGMTGRATGPHLHWAIKWNDERINPMSLTGPMR
jgi:murein DD-endopeptidase MepM/ murein hydrolase activator NlpD